MNEETRRAPVAAAVEEEVRAVGQHLSVALQAARLVDQVRGDLVRDDRRIRRSHGEHLAGRESFVGQRRRRDLAARSVDVNFEFRGGVGGASVNAPAPRRPTVAGVLAVARIQQRRCS